MNFWKYSCWSSLYLICWIIYLILGAITDEGGRFTSILLITLLLWSVILFCKDIKKKKLLPLALRVLIVLLSSYVIYGIFPVIYGQHFFVQHDDTEIPAFLYIKQALVSILPLYAFYYYGRNGKLSDSYLKFFSIVFFFVIIIIYYANEAKFLQKALEEGSSATEFTNNSSYNFIYLIPYLYLFKKRSALIFMTLIAVFLLIGMKRGAILTGGIGIFLYIRDLLNNSSKNQRILTYIGIFIVLTIISFYTIQLYNESAYFQLRIQRTLEGSTSGRDRISNSLFSYLFNSANFVQLLFGSGANATLIHSENFAHNDWLEMMVDQGFIGVILLGSFYYSLWINVKQMKKHSILYYQSFRTLFALAFIKSFFSMSICSMWPYLTLLMGSYLAQLSFANFKNTYL